MSSLSLSLLFSPKVSQKVSSLLSQKKKEEDKKKKEKRDTQKHKKRERDHGERERGLFASLFGTKEDL